MDTMGEEEKRYRAEAPEEEESTERRGLLRPLPSEEGPAAKPTPYVTFLGRQMTEDRRDRILTILMPLCVGVIDATIYTLILVHVFASSGIYLYVLPMLAAVPIGLVSLEMKNGMLGAILTAVFFVIFYIAVMLTPAMVAPGLDLGGIVVLGLAVSFAYFIVIVLMSFLGVLIGFILREFF